MIPSSALMEYFFNRRAPFMVQVSFLLLYLKHTMVWMILILVFPKETLFSCENGQTNWIKALRKTKDNICFKGRTPDSLNNFSSSWSYRLKYSTLWQKTACVISIAVIAFQVTSDHHASSKKEAIKIRYRITQPKNPR